MHPKLQQWIAALFAARVGKQILVVRDIKEHSDLRTIRAHTKQFEIWHLSKSLVLYPDGYKFVPPEDYQGLDGTVPDLKDEQPQRELAGVLHSWLTLHQDSKIFFLHTKNDFWKLTCQLANAQSTDTLSVAQLKSIFKIDTGEAEDQEVEYPRRLRDFLDHLSLEDETKLIEFLESKALDV